MSNEKINLKLEKLRRKKNLELLKSNHVYGENMEHDACGVGLVSSTDGKKSRKVVEYGIEALKAVGIEEQLMLMEKLVMALVYI